MELLSIRSRTLTMVFPPAVIGNSYHWFGHVPGLFFMLPVRTVPTQNITTHSGYDRVVNKFHADYKQEQITNPVRRYRIPVYAARCRRISPQPRPASGSVR